VKPIPAIVFLIIGMTLAPLGQTSSLKADRESKEAQALLKVEREWLEAFKNRDKAALDRILADDFIFTDEEGQVYSKAQYIEAVTKIIKVDSYDIGDITIRVYGDTGIVGARWTGKITVDGKDASGAIRYTDTCVKRQERWQVVASQDTRIPKKGDKHVN
jgi:ketosteroid isomerase-like protein